MFGLPLMLLLCTACNSRKQAESVVSTTNDNTVQKQEEAKPQASSAMVNMKMDKNIRSIFQDKKGNYWFGTNDAGLYCYDGKQLSQYTVKDVLANNQVQSIQEDDAGNIWLGTGVFGVSKFDGKTFSTFTNKENLIISNGNEKDWKMSVHDLWFYAGGGAYRYNGNAFVYLPLSNATNKNIKSQQSSFILSDYGVYSILKDKKGQVWFGTQSNGVCCYDGKKFTWFTEHDLSGSAVLALFEDSKGNIWFGNNGGGLFRYDGKTLINLTKEKGLSNEAFKVNGTAGPGTLSRVYCINEDRMAHLWIGTVDAGVWQYDGNAFINYTTKNGLSSNATNFIYKDKNDEMWFGTDANGICKFNGHTFYPFTFQK